MIITKSQPFTLEEIDKLKEVYEIYIKTVIDLKKKICSAGAPLHADSEKLLLEQGSEQANLWGGGVNVETWEIDYNSFINIRPQQNNKTNTIQDPKIQEQFEHLMRHFFKELYEQ